MANAYVSMLDLIVRLVHLPVFGLTWLSIGLLLTITTRNIPNDLKSGRSLLIVKSIGYTLAFVFLVPALISIFLTIR